MYCTNGGGLEGRRLGKSNECPVSRSLDVWTRSRLSPEGRNGSGRGSGSGRGREGKYQYTYNTTGVIEYEILRHQLHKFIIYQATRSNAWGCMDYGLWTMDIHIYFFPP